MKSLNCLVVNWDRVESLRDRSDGSIIGCLGGNELSRHWISTHRSTPPNFNADLFTSPMLEIDTQAGDAVCGDDDILCDRSARVSPPMAKEAGFGPKTGQGVSDAG